MAGIQAENLELALIFFALGEVALVLFSLLYQVRRKHASGRWPCGPHGRVLTRTTSSAASSASCARVVCMPCWGVALVVIDTIIISAARGGASCLLRRILRRFFVAPRR